MPRGPSDIVPECEIHIRLIPILCALRTQVTPRWSCQHETTRWTLTSYKRIAMSSCYLCVAAFLYGALCYPAQPTTTTTSRILAPPLSFYPGRVRVASPFSVQVMTTSPSGYATWALLAACAGSGVGKLTCVELPAIRKIFAHDARPPSAKLPEHKTRHHLCQCEAV